MKAKTILAAIANTAVLPGIGTLLQKRWKEGIIQSMISLLTLFLIGTALAATIQNTKAQTQEIEALILPAITSLLGLLLLIGNWIWSIFTSKPTNNQNSHTN